ncbi:hypothetical protein [Paraburkholderia bryophila]|uniref:Lipoprotein n=1 Tax=Paraburkholderia bryophila TaxID=420952 RepID=A0A329CU43_9BURK|nr:hypothetical protein [Paraburkholderia bryophila]RAS38296.1 hypothetical protein BX591_102592 [Paraburkholderia bryophila]
MKNNFLLIVVSMIVASALIGCNSSPDKRYASVSGLSTAAPTAPILDITAVASAPAAPTTIKDLPERAEAAYITALSAKTKTAADLQAALAKNIVAPKTSLDNTVISRTLLITVSPSSFHLGDRLTYLYITVVPDNFVFTGVTATATTWGSQPIDTLDITNNVQFQPELDVTLAGAVKGTAKGPLTASHQTDVKANTVEPFEQPTANLRGDRLVLTQTGARGIDLYGTTLVKLNLSPKPDSQSNVESVFIASNLKLTDDTGAREPAKKASIDVVEAKGLKGVRYTATAYLSYGLRHVVDGYQTYREDDDTVQYMEGHTQVCVVLASPTDTNFAIWGIFVNKSDPLAIATDEGPRQLSFTSADDAQRFATWLSNGPEAKIGGRTLGTLKAGDIDAGLQPMKADQTYTVQPTSTSPSPEDFPNGSACKNVTNFPESGAALKAGLNTP